MAREGDTGSLFWTIIAFLLGTLSGKWATARSRTEQAFALAAALERVAALEAENDRLRDEAAQRLDSTLPPLLPRPMVRIHLPALRKRRRRL